MQPKNLPDHLRCPSCGMDCWAPEQRQAFARMLDEEES